MHLLSTILRWLGKLLKSFLFLLIFIFIGIPLGLLSLIFPPLKRKIESLNSSSTSQTETNEDFLTRLFQLMDESQGNPEVIYPFLQQNLDNLNLTLIASLENFVTPIFNDGTEEQKSDSACITALVGRLICEFPLGNKADNIEIGINCCQLALQIYTREAFPREWARSQIDLGLFYLNRIREDKVDNIEIGIN